MQKQQDAKYTRKISPKLGLLGFLGLLGCLGFVPSHTGESSVFMVQAFFFFSFFGFFSFYYEGKLANTLIDERFAYNAQRAAAIANRIGLMTIIFVAIFTMSVFKIKDISIMLSILIATIGLAFGLSVFLSQYLLYRFETEE